MLVLVCKTFVNKKNGFREVLVDYAVDYDTLQNVPIESDTPQKLGARWHEGLQEWVLDCPFRCRREPRSEVCPSSSLR